MPDKVSKVTGLKKVYPVRGWHKQPNLCTFLHKIRRMVYLTGPVSGQKRSTVVLQQCRQSCHSVRKAETAEMPDAFAVNCVSEEYCRKNCTVDMRTSVHSTVAVRLENQRPAGVSRFSGCPAANARILLKAARKYSS